MSGSPGRPERVECELWIVDSMVQGVGSRSPEADLKLYSSSQILIDSFGILRSEAANQSLLLAVCCSPPPVSRPRPPIYRASPDSFPYVPRTHIRG